MVVENDPINFWSSVQCLFLETSHSYSRDLEGDDYGL